MTALDLPHLKSWVGRSIQARDAVTPRLVEEFRATFDPHLARVGEGETPLALHWCLAPPAAPMAELGSDGHPARGGFLPPVPLPRRMWAGGSLETLGALKIGDDVVRTSRIADVSVKEGRTGTLCFVNVDYEFSTSAGIAIRERHDIVYRDVGPQAAPQKPPAAAGEGKRGELVWSIEATPTLLFRYSALTFNGHRIHYDFPYVTQVEGYAGLVVHGPLQASLLFNLAAMIGGSPPRTFDYRGLSPLIAGQVFEVHASRKADRSVECWTQSASGVMTMQAGARW
jgi:3-methylfumaryl-CoA hydratase